MATLTSSPRAELVINFSIDEKEARALKLISEYSMNDILKGIESIIGESQVKTHGEGLRQFFNSVGNMCGTPLDRIDAARKLFNVDYAKFEIVRHHLNSKGTE